MASIAIANISKSFAGTPVLRDVSLAIRDGEFLSLVGPSGCGKSTLLRVIAGLEQQDSGSIHIGERCVDAERPGQRDVAMVFQSYALYPHMSVYDNMAAPLRQRSLTAFERGFGLSGVLASARAKEQVFRREIEATAEMLDLTKLLDRKPAQLSGGQRQRAALGRAIVRHPKAFLMDEPLSNLDAMLRDTVRAELSALHRRLGTTFLYVTHDQAEAMTMSDRIAVIMEGQLLQVGTPAEVYHNPADLRVARFIGTPRINVLPGEVDSSGRLSLFGQALSLEIDHQPAGRAHIAFRPQAVTLDDIATGLGGTIAHIENLGADILLHVHVDGAPEPVVVRESYQAGFKRHIGDRIGLSLDSSALLVFDLNGSRRPTPSPVAETR